MTDARGLVRNYAFDNAGRMLTKSFPAAANENVAYVYDSIAGGNFGKGRMTSMTDESGSTAYVYDARGNVLTETRTIGGQVYTVGYLYDLADRVSQITYPSGRIITYVRDAQGRVTSVTTKQNAAAAVVTLASGIAWQPFSGLVSAMTYGNGLTEADSYSLDYEVNRLLLQNGPTSLIDRTHAHADLLNLTGITDAVTPANTQTFGYSAANRLSTASGVYGGAARRTLCRPAHQRPRRDHGPSARISRKGFVRRNPFRHGVHQVAQTKDWCEGFYERALTIRTFPIHLFAVRINQGREARPASTKQYRPLGSRLGFGAWPPIPLRDTTLLLVP